jgi:alpha-L-fucosidase
MRRCSATCINPGPRSDGYPARMYGGLTPGFWNDGAHGTTTVSKTNPDLHYVHVLTKPARDTFITLRDNGYRVTQVRNFRTGAAMDFSQANGFLTIKGITNWDPYDTVFIAETAGRVGMYSPDQVVASATASADDFPALTSRGGLLVAR